MSVRRSLIVLALIFFALPALVFSMRANQLRSAKPDQNLVFYVVQPGAVYVTVNAIGMVDAVASANLSFTKSGRVGEVLAKPGDVVVAGDVLARLGSDDEQLAYDRALQSLHLAQLQKEQLLEPASEGDIAVAQANVNSAWGAYAGIQNAVSNEDVQAANLRYQQAAQAEQDAITARNTVQGPQTEASLQLLDAQIGAAGFNKEIARLQMEAVQSSNGGSLNAAYARVVQAQKVLEQVQAGPTQARIDQADVSIQQAQAQVDQALKALTDRQLLSPFDGVVTAVNTEVGSLVGLGVPVMQIMDVSALHVTVQVEDVDIRQIAPGMSAIVKLDALPGLELPATIEQIALLGTNDNGIISYDVRVRLDGFDPRVRVGLTADASVVVDERTQVLVVPNEYIRLDRLRNRSYVSEVNSSGQLEEIEVQLGLRGQDSSEVISGLHAGDVLAVDLGGDQLSIFGG
jgi:HlyD family secretion protein